MQGKYRLKNYIYTLAFLCGGFHIFFMLVGGFLDGFGKSPYSFAFWGIIINFSYVFSLILANESARAYLVNNGAKGHPHLTVVFASIFFTLLNLSIIKIMSLTSPFAGIKYAGDTVLPLFSENLLTSYLAYLGGPVPAIIYQGMLKGFQWFSPVLPNSGWMTKTFIGTLIPFASLIFVQQVYNREAREVRNVARDRERPLEWILTCVISVLMVWFAVGLFPVYPKVIITGSMMPVIDPGDVVIMKKVDGETIKVGDVVQFRYAEMDVIHRVIEVTGEDPLQYKTKGDNNSSPDSEPVSAQQIEGRLVKVIPKIGWPTLILRSSGGISTDNVEI
ncbi:MAG: signal peptidase I [Peptococcaceae bacterium]